MGGLNGTLLTAFALWQHNCDTETNNIITYKHNHTMHVHVDVGGKGVE